MMLWTTDLLMVGRLGVEALNAVTLGRLWVMGTFTAGMGLLFGLDPLASQAHGARDRERLGDALVNGCGLALLLSLPLAALWWATGPLLLAFGQDPETVRLAKMFVRVQIPALPFFLVFIALRQYLQARGIVRPALWISLGANFVNVSANWVLIYGKFGFPRLGVVGSGLATALTQVGDAGRAAHRLSPLPARPRRRAQARTLATPVAWHSRHLPARFTGGATVRSGVLGVRPGDAPGRQARSHRARRATRSC